MKRCPSCNRTYSDETMSFCLADGSLLSAPYEPRREEAPPTEIMPSPTRPGLPATQPAIVEMPTITSLPLHGAFAGTKDGREEQVNEVRPMVWIGLVFLAVTIIGGVGVSILYGLDQQRLHYWVLLAQLNPIPTTITALILITALLSLTLALIRVGSKRRRRVRR